MFLIFTTDDGRMLPWEYLPASAITPKVGLALYQTGGNLAVASGTTKPTYISMREEETPLTTGDLIPVVRVQPDVVFETTLSAAAEGLQVGQKVTIAGDGLQVTGTTTSGVAEVIGFEGTEAGDRVRVRFN